MPLDFDVLVVDTSILVAAGHQLQSSDLQKVLKLGREKKLRIVVPHVAWEEWRTGGLADLQKELAQARALLKTLKRRQTNSVLKNFPPVESPLPTDEELDKESRARSREFAVEMGIEVVDLGDADAARAWKRYFALPVAVPFNPEVVREERRKDIPDSWILEAAIGLRTETNKIAALCRDGALSKALQKEGFTVYRTASALAAEIDRDSGPPPSLVLTPAEVLSRKLDEAAASARERQRRILGFIAYLSDPSKGELSALVKRTDIPPEAADNALISLLNEGLIVDTGNHYIVPEDRLAEGAAGSVELEMIGLLAT